MINQVSHKAFIPSKYQQGVFDWVTSGAGHAVVKAVPGSGKSTTLIHASKLLTTPNAVFLAFNKSIKLELAEKLKEHGSLMQAQTINSFGLSALTATGKKYKTDGKKYDSICHNYLASKRIDGYSADEYKRYQKLKKLVSLARMTLCDITSQQALSNLVAFYGIEFDEDEWPIIWKGIEEILSAGEIQAKKLGIIDFDDQIYLPVKWGLTPEKKDFIFIDEAQDLNAARLELIIRSVNGTGRLLFVGDENQSIYGFSGADTQSMNKIIERTNAITLPLSICYRCPKSHIDLCASIIPGLEARENAPEGTIEHILREKLYSYVMPGDLILCRLNAPLVSTCLSLIREGVRAKVRGSEIGTSLVETINKLQKQYRDFCLELFIEIINNYRDLQARMISKGDDADMKIAALDDRIDTMKALHEGYCEQNPGGGSIEGLCSYIENFFSDEQGSLVILSTVHKAKGLEENRVFILQPEKMPHPKAKPGWQMEQEMNIKYVAFSRSKDALYFVHDTMPAVEEEQKTGTQIQEDELSGEIACTQNQDKSPSDSVITKSKKGGKREGSGRKAKDLVSAHIKLTERQMELTKGVDRSELIRKLLDDYLATLEG
jgi:DNA helicase II / ATP-dependent DNA helicase PcrA